MKKGVLGVAFLMGAIMLIIPGLHAQQQQQQNPPAQQEGWYCPRMGQRVVPQQTQTDEGWYCPWCGRGQGMGPGMKHRGYGRGMMHHGRHGRAGDCPWAQKPPAVRQGKPLSEEQARMLLENYLSSTGNPNLKLGEITEKEIYYEARIVTQDGSLVDKIQVNKETGWLRSAY